MRRNECSGKLRPRLDEKTSAAFAADLTDLQNEWRAKGFYTGTYTYAAMDGLIIATLFAIGCAIPQWSLISGICIGLAVHQCGRACHEIGHRAGIFSVQQLPNESVYRKVLLMMNVCLGFDGELWKRDHRQHHEYTMHESDVQIKSDYLPVFSHHLEVVRNVLKNPEESAVFKWIISNQHTAWLVVVLLFAKWNKLIIDFIEASEISRDLVRRRCALLIHFAVMVYCHARAASPLMFFLAFNFCTGMLHLQLLFNHLETEHHENGDVNDKAQQVVHSINYSSSCELERYFHCSLANQIEHHVDPKIPSERLAVIEQDVRILCAKHKLPYTEKNFFRMVWNYTLRLQKTAFEAGKEARNIARRRSSTQYD